MTERRLRVAVLGVGHLGQHHARVYAELPQAELVAVVDNDAERGQMIARRHKTRWVGDYKSLMTGDVGGVDAVSVVVPTIAHYDIGKFFLERGVHCMVEKPITSTVEQATELVELARQRERILQVGHIERFNAAVVRLRQLVNRPAFIEVHRLGPYDPRVKDVGVVLDLMIHDIDIVLQLVDSPIARLESIGVALFTDKEDIANARLTFENGCIANLTVSRVTPVKKRKLRIFQPDTYLSINYAKQSMEVYRRVVVPNPEPSEASARIVRKTERLPREEPLKKELEHFLDCVSRGVQPHVTGEEAKSALEIAIQVTEQIREASQTKEVFRPMLAPSGNLSGEFVGYAPLASVPEPSVFRDVDLDDEEED